MEWMSDDAEPRRRRPPIGGLVAPPRGPARPGPERLLRRSRLDRTRSGRRPGPPGGRVREHPEVAEFRTDPAGSRHNLGLPRSVPDRDAEAPRSLRRGPAIREPPAREEPSVTDPQRDRAHRPNGAGDTLESRGADGRARVREPSRSTPRVRTPGGTMKVPTALGSIESEDRGLRDLSAAQWKSGLAAWLGWLFDGLDMHLYTLVAAPFVATLLALSDPNDPRVRWYG